MSNAELACSYAALILADGGAEITADNLNAVLKSANVSNVDAVWTTVFAKALKGVDVAEFVSKIGAGGGAPAPAAAAVAAPAAAAAAPAAAAAAPKKEEKKEESDEDIGMSLFD